MKFRWAVLALTILLLSSSSSSCSPSDKTTPADFPLADGAYWVYQGIVKWTVGRDILQKDLSWKMEVIETVKRDGVVGYALKGHPSDLAWYEEGKPPSEYAIIQLDNRLYRADMAILKRLKDRSDTLQNLVRSDQIIFDFPLAPDKKFCEPEHIDRADSMYCWIVGQDPQTLSWQIDGIPSSKTILEYTLSMATLPDHSVTYFAPGVGITRYVYVHHGTISEVDVRLVEYHPGSER